MCLITIRSLLLTIIVIFSSIAQADLGMVNIHLQATIIAKGCSVSSGSKDQTVNLGETATNRLKNNGGKGEMVPFTIKLEECDGKENTIKIKFTGKNDTSNSTLLSVSGADSAKDVAISILDKEQQKLSLDVVYSNYKSVVDSTTLIMKFYAQYVATGPNVTAGKADGDANFTIEYE